MSGTNQSTPWQIPLHDPIKQWSDMQALTNAQTSNEGQQIANKRSQQAFQVAKLQALQTQLAKHLGDPHVTQAQVLADIDDGVSNGSYTREQADLAKQRVTAVGDNPGALHQHLLQGLSTVLPALDAIKAATPTPGPDFDQGSKVQPSQRAPLIGPATPGSLSYPQGPIQKGLTPGESTAPSTIVTNDENGNPVTVPSTHGQSVTNRDPAGAPGVLDPPKPGGGGGTPAIPALRIPGTGSFAPKAPANATGTPPPAAVPPTAPAPSATPEAPTATPPANTMGAPPPGSAVVVTPSGPVVVPAPNLTGSPPPGAPAPSAPVVTPPTGGPTAPSAPPEENGGIVLPKPGTSSFKPVAGSAAMPLPVDYTQRNEGGNAARRANQDKYGSDAWTTRMQGGYTALSALADPNVKAGTGQGLINHYLGILRTYGVPIDDKVAPGVALEHALAQRQGGNTTDAQAAVKALASGTIETALPQLKGLVRASMATDIQGQYAHTANENVTGYDYQNSLNKTRNSIDQRAIVALLTPAGAERDAYFRSLGNNKDLQKRIQGQMKALHGNIGLNSGTTTQ